MSAPHPPKLFTRFFKWYCNPRLQEAILGDLEEQFDEDIKTKGLSKARRRFAWTVIRFFRKDIIKPISGGQKLNYYGMLKNYFTTSIRFIKREKTYALMNIFGLAMGIACALVIYKILDHELSYNKHQENFHQLYRVLNEDHTTSGIKTYRAQTHPLADALRNDFPGINAAMTFYDQDGLIGIPTGQDHIQRFQERKGIVFVEPQFLELFTLHFIAGDKKTALNEPGKVIINESKALKYFGLSHPQLHEAIGRPIILENEKTVYVSAVIKDEPNTSDFPFEVLFHYQDQDVANRWFFEGKDWEEYTSSTNCYLLLKDGTPSSLEADLVPFAKKYLPEYAAKNRTYRLQPLSDLHHSEEVRRTYAGVTTTFDELMILGLVGLFLIITACINFINLSTAQAVKRSKEVGVRKTMGSSKRQLVVQFLCETFLITLFATILGALMATVLIDQVAQILSYKMSLNLLDGKLIYFLLVTIIGVTFFAGLYPSVILARMNPILAIKNNLNAKQASGFLSFRRALVVLQFAISQILIIGVLILNAQMNFFKSKDLGFNDDSIIVVELPENDSTKLSVLKNELLKSPAIQGVSFSTSGPMSGWRSTNPIFHPNIEGEDVWGNLKNVDENFFNLYELDLIAGEPFKRNSPKNLTVVNRQVTEVLGFQKPQDALGERVKYGRGSIEFTIVGVVEDFHAASLHQDIENVFLANFSWNIFQAGIKIHPSQQNLSELKATLNHIESSWETSFPEHVFDFQFYDDHLASFYQLEQSVSKVMRLFVVIAIIIGALGLYALVAFMANQKVKEIGIRKVMGATSLAIWNIFSKELSRLLIIAILVSGPIAYYIMRAFLDTYAYRISLGLEFFVAAILASVIIALLTVGYKSWKVAKANPVDSLRDE
ncbi:FtsX-like permease family protein [Ekhidna sp.]|jgi:putative ABC transport system permease protein|uniref:FtsX-like permease family protein n=1 Tax=Ekhidna sp. TaxID=2608089 RepID=UPI0032ED7F49